MNTETSLSPERLLTVEQTAAHLHALIETCLDSRHWFRKTADGIDDGELKYIFTQYARQRTRFIHDLEAEIRRLGYTPDRMGSLAETMHHSWTNIKSAFADGDEVAILAECERSEEAAVRAYKKGFEARMAESVHTIVFEQYMDVYECYSEMHTYTLAIKSKISEPVSEKGLRFIGAMLVFLTTLMPQIKNLRQMMTHGK